jgi:hypothetical protein
VLNKLGIMAETLATEASGKTRLHIVLWRTKTDVE